MQPSHLTPLRMLTTVLALALMPAVARSQSGTPAPMEPLKQQDARLAAVSSAMSKTKNPNWTAIAPDGAKVAWTVSGRQGTQIHLTSVADPDVAKETMISTGSSATNCTSNSPVWAPDSTSLAFLSTCGEKSDTSEQAQVYLWSMATGTSKQLTHVTGAIESLAWSPDGRSVGFLFVENATRSAGALAAMKPWSGVIGEDGVEIQRVGVVDVASGTFSQVTPTALHVYEFGWSPDSKALTYVAAAPPGENNWWVAQLYTQTIQRPGMQDLTAAAGGTYEPRVVFDPAKTHGELHGLQIAVPRWSPDGSQIAFIGGLMSDQGATGGDVYVIPAVGGEPKNLTPGRPATPIWLTWKGKGELVVHEDARGKTHLFGLDVATGKESKEADLTLSQAIGSGGDQGQHLGGGHGSDRGGAELVRRGAGNMGGADRGAEADHPPERRAEAGWWQDGVD